MNCTVYEDYALGQLDSAHFTEHAKQCPECQKYMEQDEKLMELIGTMDQPIEAPDLWNRIEKSLQSEQAAKKPGRSWSGFLRVAAVLLLVLGGGGYWTWQSYFQPLKLIPQVTERLLPHRITPTPQQRLYMDFTQMDVTVTGHNRYDIEIDAVVTATSTNNTEMDTWLDQAALMVQPYQDYIRVQLNTPPETNETEGVQVSRSIQVRVPFGQALYIGNSDGSIHLEGIAGNIQVEAKNSAVDVRRLAGFPPETLISLTTTDQPVSLSLPEQSDAVVIANTTAGEINSDYELYFFDEYRRRASLYLGENNTRIEIRTTGDIDILKEGETGNRY